MATLADRKSRWLERIPDNHLIPPYEGKPVATAIPPLLMQKTESKTMHLVKDLLLSYIIMKKTRQIIVLECTQHRSYTTN